MKQKIIDVRGLSDRDAIERLCSEINLLRSELVKILSEFDGGLVVMDDGQRLEDRLLQLENKEE